MSSTNDDGPTSNSPSSAAVASSVPLPLSVPFSAALPVSSSSLPTTCPVSSQWAPAPTAPPQPPPLAISTVAPLPANPALVPDVHISQPPKTTVSPTIRDRAYTYVMHLSVTRVRDICRASGLKQFGKKAESQPRLFWGADSLVDPASESREAWETTLPGFRDWLDAPHREHSTLWRLAPPRSSRPADYLTYFSHPSTGVRRSIPLPISSSSAAADVPMKEDSNVPVPPNSNIGLMDTMDEDADTIVVSVGSGELPTERDRLYTYTRSLSITVVRRLCKRLGLKQFGRKKESQTRLFWHLTSDTYTPIADLDGEVDPKTDAIRWAGATTPERWFRAPLEIQRPATLTSRIRDRSVQRRRKFASHELARLVAALVSSPEMRDRTVAVLSTNRRGGDAENAFWGACVAPLFNDQAFQPRISGSVSREHHSGANQGTEPRGGDELRRHFDRACPTFVRAYRRWQQDNAPAGKYELYLRERRRSDSGAPLSPTEKRAGIYFSVLRCGEENEISDVLSAIIEHTDENEEKSEGILGKTNPDENNTINMKPEEDLGSQGIPTGEGDMQQNSHEEGMQPMPPSVEPINVDAAGNVGGQPGTTYATPPAVMEEHHVAQTVEELGPVVDHNPENNNTTAEGQALNLPQEEQPNTLMVDGGAVPEFDSTEGGHSVGAGGLLGKREAPLRVEDLWAELQQLRKQVAAGDAVSAKRRESMERATHEKVLNEAVISHRKLIKDLENDQNEDNEKLKSVHARRIHKLRQEIEELSKEE